MSIQEVRHDSMPYSLGSGMQKMSSFHGLSAERRHRRLQERGRNTRDAASRPGETRRKALVRLVEVLLKGVTMPLEPVRGSCLCGSVRFEIKPPLSLFRYCYTSRC